MPPNDPPKQIKPTKLGDYLDVMGKALFQTGISWEMIEPKWPAMQEAFKGSDSEIVSDFSVSEVQALVVDTRIIHNAWWTLALEQKHRSFPAYLHSKDDDFNALVKDMRNNFKFLGDMGAFYFLYVIGEKVPDHEEFIAAR